MTRQLRPLSEIVEINPRVRLDKGASYSFVPMEELTPGRRYVHARTTKEAGGGAKFCHGDTLFARITPCLENGKIAQFIAEPGQCAFGSTEYWVLRAREGVADPGFVYYLAVSDVLRGPAEKSMAGASGRQRADVAAIQDLKVPAPDLPTQRRIAAILSAYDDLIENNTRRIAILEEMARRIYEEWFVHFRFPGHEQVKMVESESGLIPEGWKVSTLGEVCSRLQSGGTPSRSNGSYWTEGTVDWYKTKELWDGFLFDSEEKITESAVADKKTRIFESGTILMAIYGAPTVGRLGITTRRSACNQAALGFELRSDWVTKWFLLHTLMLLRQEFNNKAQGAAQQNISKEKVAETQFLLPRMEVMAAFDDKLGPMWSMLLNLQTKNRNLRTTRDLLLPKLISGEVEVSVSA